MNVEYTGRQTTISKKLKLQTDEGLARIAKIVGLIVSAQVVLSTEKYRQNAEVTIKTRRQSLVATCEGTEMAMALHEALDKIERQALRHKKRTMTIKRHPKTGTTAMAVVAEPLDTKPQKKAATATATKTSPGRKAVSMLVHSFPSKSPLPEPHLVRSSDSVALRPMSIEEAVKEAEFRDRDVFVFRDPKGQAMVLHRKRDGKMELIEVP